MWIKGVIGTLSLAAPLCLPLTAAANDIVEDVVPGPAQLKKTRKHVRGFAQWAQLRSTLNKVLVFQDAEREADRRARHAELVGDGGLGDPLAGLELAAHYEAAELADDLIETVGHRLMIACNFFCRITIILCALTLLP